MTGKPTPYAEGYQFSVWGKPLSNNPYKLDSPDFIEWKRGWQDKFYGDKFNDSLRKKPKD